MDVKSRDDVRGLEALSRVSAAVASELNLERAVQIVTDAATELTNAGFGAFFYNVVDSAGESYMLYALSGVPREEFSKFPMPRNTAVFAPTFNGEGVIRSDDITRDPRFGKNEPHYGMPKGHLPVRSYLAAPVVSRSGEVLGGLFLGHAEVGRFTEESERIVTGIAAQAASAIDNARLFQAAEREIDRRRQVESLLRELNDTLEERVHLRTQELNHAYEALGEEIAEREALQARALETSEQFRILVQGVVDYAIYMLDPNGRVSTWNAGAERNKGYSASEILGQHFSIFYTEEGRAAGEPERTLENARKHGRTEMEGWRLRKDGQRFWASVVVDAVYDEDGELAGYAKVTRDITEKREAQQELERAREALIQSQKMEAVGQLTGGIAHDFNNVLAGIIGAMHLLERRLQAGRYDEAGKYVTAALESAQRAAALTSRLLAFGRRQSLDLKPVDVRLAVQSIEALIRRSIGENIAIETDLALDEPKALTDQHQLESALLNLAINARDAMPDGGRIRISTCPVHIGAYAANADLNPGDYLLLTVSDTGVGMKPEITARAFEPFFTTKPSGVGTGLGLSMVYGFVKQTGGHVAIESAEGQGTIIKLYLPVAKTEAKEEAKPREASPQKGRGEVVLVVEDDALVRTLVRDVLEDLGYEPLLAADAKLALPLLDSRQRIDLLISDVGLPGMNGRQLAEMARQMRPELKVLFLTGYAEHASVRSTFLGRDMELMTKPFAVDELAAKIKHMLALERQSADA